MRPRLIAVDDYRPTGLPAYHQSASMRPRLIAVDDRAPGAEGAAFGLASMRPRLIAVDDTPGGGVDVYRVRPASMRPRLIAVDDDARAASSLEAIPGFNEATADRRG